MSRVLLIGAGGHARVVAEALRVRGREVHAVVTLEGGFDGVEQLTDEAAFARWPEGRDAALGVGGRPARADPGTEVRRRLYETYRERGFALPAVIGAGVVLSSGIALSDGLQLMAGAVVQPEVRFGTNVLVNTGARIDHDCEVGDHVVVAPGAVLCGGVAVGAGSWIGAGAVVLEGRRIGAGALVAAGAVVTRDVPDGGFLGRGA